MRRESETQAAILGYLATRRDIRAARMNTGAARDQRGHFIRFGVPGQADILGIIAPHGRVLAIEVKSQRGQQSQQQRRFQAMIEKFGGLYILARSVADVERALP